jgi:hypothetical protein
VYVDAFNVYYGGRALCGRGTSGWRWLDIADLALDLINPHVWPAPELTRLVYCTAPRDRKGDPSSLADQQTYVAALQHGSRPPRRIHSPGPAHLPAWLPIEEVHGPDGHPELQAAVSTFEEKGSDVNVASYLLIDVLAGRIDAAIVFSNDSDLRFPLAQARLRIPVATINPSAGPTPTDLKGDPCTGAGRHWWRRLRPADFLNHQLPDPIGPHVKPPGW